MVIYIALINYNNIVSLKLSNLKRKVKETMNIYTNHLANTPRKTTVVTIGGPAQNGKDTTAGILKARLEQPDMNKKVLLIHHADLLKDMAKSLFGWDGKKDEKGRTLLQYMGTDVVRKKRPDYWVEHILSLLDLFDEEWDFVLIPDSRFPNEIDAYKDAGYNTRYVRVVRPGYDNGLTPEQLAHPSETALNNYPTDIVVVNDGNLEQLTIKVDSLAKELVGGV
jgi:hypothetical protein